MAKTKFRPLLTVVVRRVESGRRPPVRLIIRTTPRESRWKAKSSTSPPARARGGKLVPLDVKSGDRVLFGKWSGTKVKLDGQEVLILKEVGHHGRHRVSLSCQTPECKRNLWKGFLRGPGQKVMAAKEVKFSPRCP